MFELDLRKINALAKESGIFEETEETLTAEAKIGNVLVKREVTILPDLFTEIIYVSDYKCNWFTEFMYVYEEKIGQDGEILSESGDSPSDVLADFLAEKIVDCENTDERDAYWAVARALLADKEYVY